MDDLSGHVLVLGLGASGLAVARHLAGRAAEGEDLRVTALDEGDTERLAEVAAELRDAGVEVRLGADRVPEADVAVVSPGIPPHRPLLRSALESGATVISEIEYAFRVADAPFVAVTGTNGKTTTTALIAHLLNGSGIPAEAVGNIGLPLTEAAAQAGEASVLVAEVSSFQLAFIDHFRPRVSVLLNVTPDHIDWHGSLDAYAADKARVFENQGPGDTAVIDVDDPGSSGYADRVEAAGVSVRRVSRSACAENGAALVEGVLTLVGPHGGVPLVPAADLRIRGDHNVSNALAGAAAAVAMGAGVEDVREGLRTFEPIEHRLEPAGETGGVEWFNDSKATNPDAVLKALTAFADRPVVVLLGGRNKGNDFSELAREAADRCAAAVVFGEAAGEIAQAFAGRDVIVLRTRDLESAVGEAARVARSGDVVLLSPGCASFDEFAGYDERGRAFKALVQELAETGRSR